MSLGTISGNNSRSNDNDISKQLKFSDICELYPSNDQISSWHDRNNNDDNRTLHESAEMIRRRKISEGPLGNISDSNYDIVELDVEDPLAKYAHYCHVCVKGFKRDANLRMHMRAHGDEYKTNAALVNPMRGSCRWNQKHAKFQPLKSMIRVKRQYRRSHCPKMYVCKWCKQKQFSVLSDSDLRTHEKHCSDLRWRCSCGNTFSRKDKLMGHVGLFFGHSPVGVNVLPTQGKFLN
ncbi:Zinc finger protein STOP1-like protein [Hibiscus syriacus]|uniref:Zinc finger protein STOP1-like protein n=1 Tax=Hibiscus syriacus TaxID=106335 RepID=A0A6A3AP29_HIBSY|nr:Zinc finger protein STOP1-like protein [Hibiscus syriacus]